jgi:hypothetical protein
LLAGDFDKIVGDANFHRMKIGSSLPPLELIEILMGGGF